MEQVAPMKDPKFIILFVDDQVAAIEPLMDYTQSMGFEAICVADPNEAMELIKSEHNNIIVVVSDFEMGDINGLQFRAMMLPRYQDIPFIIYSGYIDEQMLHHGLANKVSAFVEKPYDFNAFEKMLTRDCLDRQQNLIEKRALRRTFIEEAFDLLEEFESLVLSLESRTQKHDSIQNIFRIVHTIKGGSGVLDWPDFTHFLHIYEDLLSKLKLQHITTTPSIASKLLKGYDFLSQALKALGSSRSIPIDNEHWSRELQLADSDFSRMETRQNGEVRQDKATDADDSIRMPTRILDEFMELSGEITVIRNSVNKLVRSLQKEVPGNKGVSLLSEYLDEMHKINSSMQGKITELRKVSLQSITKSYQRTVRDLALSLQKDIELRVIEDNLRIDTKLANVLRHALIHLLRNSADHGLESPGERLTIGKPERGVITLQAIEHAEDIVITIQDDGRGINTDLVTARALERGLFTQAELDRMTAKQIYKIIFEPGFSTAASVTDISGRGVGMDMVRTSVESVGGRIDIDSVRGQGSVFTMRLPIPKSVLIIHSLRVRAGGQPFSIPQDKIVRLIKIDPARRKERIKRMGDIEFLDQAGELYQLVDLEALTQETATVPKPDKVELSIVLVRSENLSYGLLVGAIEDAEEVVVKRLAPQIRARIFLGSTFHDNGQVGLIIDTQGVAQKLGLDAGIEEAQAEAVSTLNQTVASKDFLVFQIGAAGRYGLPLDDVFRLEDLDPRSFTMVGGHLTTIYRDRVMPLTIVHQSLQLSKDRGLLENEKVPAIICMVNGLHYALLVSKINEIISSQATIDSSLDLGPCIVGTLIHQTRILTLLNLYQLLGLKEEPKVAPSTQSLAEKTEAVSEGWGLF